MSERAESSRGAGAGTSLEKGLAILQAIASAEAPMTMAEVAAATGCNRSTAYRLCQAMERAGWIQPAGDSVSARGRKVDLGPQALGLAVLATSKYDPEARLQPIMETLARTVGETVHCGVLDETSIIHVGRAVPDAGPHMAMRLGARDPAHVTALGKAILATLTREDVLQRYQHEQLVVRTGRAIGTRTALLEELGRIARRGFALDDEESRSGVKCLGAPIFGVGGRAIFALSVTTTPVHLEGERLDAVARAVRDSAARATAAFGGVVPVGWAPEADGAIAARSA
jgi:DNA-binding IclR family transcriptional regulator